MFSAVSAGGQMLAPILGPPKRFAKRHRKPGDTKLFRLQNAFVAKSPADIRRDDTNSALIKSKMLRDRGTDHVRHLGRRVEDNLALEIVPVGKDRLSFKGVHDLA